MTFQFSVVFHILAYNSAIGWHPQFVWVAACFLCQIRSGEQVMSLFCKGDSMNMCVSYTRNTYFRGSGSSYIKKKQSDFPMEFRSEFGMDFLWFGPPFLDSRSSQNRIQKTTNVWMCFFISCVLNFDQLGEPKFNHFGMIVGCTSKNTDVVKVMQNRYEISFQK